jgi:hypothetical protein
MTSGERSRNPHARRADGSFKSIREHAAELAAYAATHTPEETRARLAELPLTVQRKILARAARQL